MNTDQYLLYVPQHTIIAFVRNNMPSYGLIVTCARIIAAWTRNEYLIVPATVNYSVYAYYNYEALVLNLGIFFITCYGTLYWWLYGQVNIYAYCKYLELHLTKLLLSYWWVQAYIKLIILFATNSFERICLFASYFNIKNLSNEPEAGRNRFADVIKMFIMFWYEKKWKYEVHYKA